MKIRKLTLFLILILAGVIYFASNFEAEVNPRVEKVPSTESEIRLRKNMEIKNIKFEDINANYVYFGDGTKQPIIFVHGTPGSSGAFFDLMSNQNLQDGFDMVSIDRLGWNTASLTSRKAEVNFRKQAEFIKKVSDDRFPSRKPILVGHSLGGSIIPRALMDYPESFSGMVVIAGTIDPNLGDPRWYNSLANTFMIKNVISSELEKSNDEIMSLKSNLEEMEDLWKNIQSPVTVIQGKKDFLVSPKNADYAKQELSHLKDKLSVIEIEDGSHFLIWDYVETIENSLSEMKDLINNP